MQEPGRPRARQYCVMTLYPSGILKRSSEIGSVVIDVTLVVIFIGPICCIISAIWPLPSMVIVISVMYGTPLTPLNAFIMRSMPGICMPDAFDRIEPRSLAPTAF